jgi:type II secretory pathway pseudopilin PulG
MALGKTRSEQRGARAAARAFTLMELMVAMVAGLVVGIAAFAFSKQSVRFFSQEARSASAQMSVLNGFQRLQADLSRAAYMSTPNMVRDRDFGRVCEPSWNTWPPTLRWLTGLTVTVEGSQLDPTVAKLPDSKYPDLVRIVGSLSTSEEFYGGPIMRSAVGNGHDVFLYTNNGPMTRSGFIEPAGGSMAQLFSPGRLLRVTDQDGKYSFAVIQAASWNVGQPFITTRTPLATREQVQAVLGTTQAPCGISANGMDSKISVLNVVEYGLANLSGINTYKNTIYSPAATAPGDQARTELVRREIFVTDVDPPAYNVDPNAEVVSEYAVDLRFGLWVTNPGVVGLQYLAPSSAAIPLRMAVQPAYAIGSPPTGPESVRSVHVRLVTRSREVDRKGALDPAQMGGALPNLPPGLTYRVPVQLPAAMGYARTRTLTADIVLTNQRGDAW